MSQKKKEEKKKKGYLPAGLILGTLGVASAAAGAIIYVTHPEEKPTEYIVLTFNQNGGELDGTTVKVAPGTTFGKVAKPRVIQAPKGKRFGDWVDKLGKTIDSTTVIKAGMVVYAGWINIDQWILSFETTDPNVKITGQKDVLIDKNAKFETINKPDVSKDTKDGAVWEFVEWRDSDNHVVNDDDQITKDMNIHPIFEDVEHIDFVDLTFSALPDEPDDADIRFNGIEGKRTFTIRMDKTLTWGEINYPIATKTSKLTVSSQTFDVNYPFNSWKIYKDGQYVDLTNEVTFPNGGTVYASFDFEPDALNSSYYVYDETNGFGKIVDGTESEGAIHIWYKNSTEPTIIARDEFNETVYLGRKITSISPNFLRDCTNFNKEIVIPQTVTSIGSGFLYGCTSYNKDITLPNSVVTIGKCFMYGCTSMNSDIKFGENLSIIEDYFLAYASKFNKKLELPNNVLYIGVAFMKNCTAFNNGGGDSTFYLPKKLTTFGESMLSYCTSLRQNIDLSQCTSLTEIASSFLFQSTGYKGTITLPTTITTIGSNFCAWTDVGSDCVLANFNLPNPSVDLALVNLTTIGSAFLNHTNYNNALYLSSCSSLQYIGDNFLRNDEAFNSALVLPDGLLYLGDYFMYDCDGKVFTAQNPFVIPESVAYVGNYFLEASDSIGYINILCPASSFYSDDEPRNDSFCTIWNGDRSYALYVKCAEWSDLSNHFKNQTVSSKSYGRNLQEWTN